MLNQILKMSLVLVLFTLGCKKESIRTDDKLPTNQESNSKNASVNSEGKAISTLKNNEFKLDIETTFSNDSLDIIDYKEDRYSSPVITTQELTFYKLEKMFKHYKLPIKHIKKRTISKTVLDALQTPIYKICLSKSSNQDCYIVYGSDYCNGSECPEFVGIYSMSGDIIYEGVSNEKNKVSLKDIVTKNKIELNNNSNCIKIENFK